jgi:hypothetical protein
VTGETIKIHNITREEAGIYTCQAFNGIPPVSKKNITVNVECKYIILLSLTLPGSFLIHDLSLGL